MNCIIYAKKNSHHLLEDFVGKSSSLNLVGIFSDSDSMAAQLSDRQDIDLIILDVETPEMDIINFINSLNYRANTIIVSSDDKFAVKAFELNIVDYLLKPVTYSRFCKAIDKVVRYHSNKKVNNSEANDIYINKGLSLVKLKIKDIIYIEARENDVVLNTKNEKFIIHFALNAIEHQFPSEIFLRINRSFIVNKSLIKAIKEDSIDLIIGNELRSIPISNSIRGTLLNKINIITS